MFLSLLLVKPFGAGLQQLVLVELPFHKNFTVLPCATCKN